MSCYRCTVRCQWRRQLWKIGETVECGGGEVPPSVFFEEIASDMPEETPGEAERPHPRRRKKDGDSDDGPGGREPGADTDRR